MARLRPAYRDVVDRELQRLTLRPRQQRQPNRDIPQVMRHDRRYLHGVDHAPPNHFRARFGDRP
jgi:hypothetical protein